MRSLGIRAMEVTTLMMRCDGTEASDKEASGGDNEGCGCERDDD